MCPEYAATTSSELDSFISHVDVGFVIRREVVIDLHVVLLAIARAFTDAEQVVQTA